jgi:hypothetical protein
VAQEHSERERDAHELVVEQEQSNRRADGAKNLRDKQK